MEEPPSQAVILAVADAEGVDPIELPPLSDTINPEVLDELPAREKGEVRITYHGYTVTVNHQGVVDLESENSKPAQSQRSVDAHRVLESAREGMSLVNPDGTFSFVNSAFASLFGYDPSELRGEHWTVLYHNEEAKRLAADILPAVRETGYWSGETVRLTKHGEPRVTDHRLALTDEDVILCTATDLTLDRTAPESAVHDHDTMVDDMEDAAFFTLDHEGYVTRWNDAAERIEGYEPSEILGKHVSTLFTEDDREQSRSEQLLNAATNKGTASEEGWLVRNDGTQFCGEMTMVASYDDAGTIRGFEAKIRDASETPANS